MSIIYVLIPLAVIIVCIAIGMFFWAVKSNQFDDLERQGYSILFDDDIKDDSKDNAGPKDNVETLSSDPSVIKDNPLHDKTSNVDTQPSQSDNERN